MNQDNPSRDESVEINLTQPEQIERQLRQLKPRTANVDVQAIVRSASEADSSVVSTGSIGRSDRAIRSNAFRSSTVRWTTVIGAWACGVVAGVLVTLVLLRQGTTPTTHVEKPRPPVENGPSSIAVDEAVPSPGEVEEPDGNAHPATAPRPPRTELLAAARLRQFYDPLADPYAARTPLRAGDYMRHRAATDSAEFRSRINDSRKQWEDSSNPDGFTPWEDLPHAPDVSIDRDRLLRELLGTDPGSLL